MSLRARAAAAWHILGPGFVTGSSDDDPSGIQTYSQTGAQFGYALATLVGVGLNFIGIPPFRMLYYAAAANGVLAPPLMAMITLVGNHVSGLQPRTVPRGSEPSSSTGPMTASGAGSL